MITVVTPFLLELYLPAKFLAFFTGSMRAIRYFAEFVIEVLTLSGRLIRMSHPIF